MRVIPIPALADNYIWLMVDMKTSRVICVDPGEARPVMDFLAKNNLILDAVLLTHHHADHIGGLPLLLKNYPEIRVYGPDDRRISYVTDYVKQKDCFERLGVKFTILDIPGHTSSHLCFYAAEKHWLFCGDTLFSAGCGRVFDGSMEELYHSLMRLRALPDETLVYCAHEYTENNLRFAEEVEPQNAFISGYLSQIKAEKKACTLPSTLAREKQINPFFRIEKPALIDYARRRGCINLDPLTVFTQLRKDKDGF